MATKTFSIDELEEDNLQTFSPEELDADLDLTEEEPIVEGVDLLEETMPGTDEDSEQLYGAETGQDIAQGIADTTIGIVGYIPGAATGTVVGAYEAIKEQTLSKFKDTMHRVMGAFTAPGQNLFEIPQSRTGKAIAEAPNKVLDYLKTKEIGLGYALDPEFLSEAVAKPVAESFLTKRPFDALSQDEVIDLVSDHLEPELSYSNEDIPQSEINESQIKSGVAMATAVETILRGGPAILMYPFRPKAPIPEKTQFAKDVDSLIKTLGEDHRTWEELSPTLKEVEETTKVKFGTGATDEVVKTVKPTFKDLPSRFKNEFFNIDYILPTKFIAHLRDNPILKWATSRVAQANRNYEALMHTWLYEPKAEMHMGRFKLVPGEGSLMMQWKSLSDESKAKLIRVAHHYDDPHRAAEVSDKILAMGIKENVVDPVTKKATNTGKEVIPALSEQEIKVYRKIRSTLDSVRDNYNLTASIAKPSLGDDVDLIEGYPGYMPHIWEGDFKAFVHPKGTVKGKPDQSRALAVRSATNRLSFRNRVKELKEKYPEDAFDISVQISTERPFGLDPDVHAFSQALNYVRKKDLTHDQLDAVENLLAQAQARRGFGVHTTERSGAYGFLSDPRFNKKDKQLIKEFETALTSYISGASKSIANLRLKAELVNSLGKDKDIAKLYPNTLAFVDRYKDNFVGKRTQIDQAFVNHVTGWLTGGRGLSPLTTPLSSGVAHVKLFLWNMKFLTAQAVQPFQMITPKLVQLNSMGAGVNITRVLSKSIKDQMMPDADIKAFGKKMAELNVISPNFIRTIEEREYSLGASGKLTRNWKTTSMDAAKGTMAASYLEELSRYQASLMFYNFLRESGVSKNAATRQAAALTNDWMVQYNKIERPLLYGSESMRPVAQFKTFQSNYLGQLLTYIKAAKDSTKGMDMNLAQRVFNAEVGPLSTFFLTSVLGAGLTGAIGIKQADFLINQYNNITGSDHMTVSEYAMAYAPDWVAFGAPSAISGRDITTLQAPELMDVTDFLNIPQISYIGDIANNARQLAYLSWKGVATRANVAELMKSMLPVSVHGWIEEYAETGQMTLLGPDEPWLVKNPKYQYKGMSVRDRDDWIARKLLSAKSLDERRITSILLYQFKSKKRDNDQLGQLVSAAAYNYLNGTPVPMDMFFDLAKKTGTDGRTFQKMFMEDAKNMMTLAIDRAQLAVRKDPKSLERLLKGLPQLDAHYTGKVNVFPSKPKTVYSVEEVE